MENLLHEIEKEKKKYKEKSSYSSVFEKKNKKHYEYIAYENGKVLSVKYVCNEIYLECHIEGSNWTEKGAPVIEECVKFWEYFCKKKNIPVCIVRCRKELFSYLSLSEEYQYYDRFKMRRWGEKLERKVPSEGYIKEIRKGHIPDRIVSMPNVSYIINNIREAEPTVFIETGYSNVHYMYCNTQGKMYLREEGSGFVLQDEKGTVKWDLQDLAKDITPILNFLSNIEKTNRLKHMFEVPIGVISKYLTFNKELLTEIMSTLLKRYSLKEIEQFFYAQRDGSSFYIKKDHYYIVHILDVWFVLKRGMQSSPYMNVPTEIIETLEEKEGVRKEIENIIVKDYRKEVKEMMIRNYAKGSI